MARPRNLAKWVLGGVIVLAALAQLVRPDRTNPPVDPSERIDAHLDVPADVQAILDRSCRDCHTHETRWPGYSRVAPVSWYVVHDVNEGREEMNLSKWGRYDLTEAREKLKDVCKEVRGGHMPVRAYTWMHSESKLSASDVERLCAWTEIARQQAAATKQR